VQTKKLVIGGRGVDAFDGGVVIGGVVTFVFGFLRFFSIGGAHFDGWSSGFFGSFGLSLCLLAALMVVGRLFLGLTMSVSQRFGPAVLTFFVAALGAAFLVVKLLVGFSISASADGLSGSASGSRSFGLVLAMIVAIVEAVVAFLAITTAGEKLQR
jgi:hypothetical protein